VNIDSGKPATYIFQGYVLLIDCIGEHTKTITRAQDMNSFCRTGGNPSNDRAGNDVIFGHMEATHHRKKASHPSMLMEKLARQMVRRSCSNDSLSQ
jgi:hypothetical protein